MIRRTGAPIRVLLVDDHRTVLWGLERLIGNEKSGMEVVGAATNRVEALDLAGRLRPDVIVLDIDLGDESGIGAIPELVAQSQGHVLVLTGLRDATVHDNAVLAGARGIVHKEDPAETILKAIDRVHQGELWLDRATTGRIFIELARAGGVARRNTAKLKTTTLTTRERELIGVLAADPGANYRKIAEKLNISEHTVRNHVTSIYGKLGVQNRLELFVYANKHGMEQ
ncbi:MAG: response regulator transcription factor [Burkholderiales bacterium]